MLGLGKAESLKQDIASICLQQLVHEYVSHGFAGSRGRGSGQRTVTILVTLCA